MDYILRRELVFATRFKRESDNSEKDESLRSPTLFELTRQ